MIARKYILVAFAFMVIIQIGVTSYTVFDSERILYKGTMYRFEVVPIDPNDPFRGKYIDLSYAVERRTYDVVHDSLSYAMIYYAELSPDERGMTQLRSLARTPHEDSDQVAVNVSYSTKNAIRVDLPFDRFYLDERLAKPAEDLVRTMLRDSTNTIYAEIYVLGLRAVVGDIKVNGESILEVLRHQAIED